jgi:hypothetical protein
MAKQAQAVLGGRRLCVVADAGYSNAMQFDACEQAGITPYVPPNRSGNSEGGGSLYTAASFDYDAASDTCRCPAGKVLTLKQINRAGLCHTYIARAEDCASCAQKPRCTRSARRTVQRHWHEEAFGRMVRRLAAQPGMMAKRRSLAEHPFGQIKCWVMGDARLLLRGLGGARTEIALAILARNLKRVINILGTRHLIATLAAG